MTTTQPVWISPQAYERLQRELATLRVLHTSAAADGEVRRQRHRCQMRVAVTDPTDS